jgi:hypothetical protein
MSHKTLKRIGLLFLLAGLAGLFFHLAKLPQHAVVTPKIPPLTFAGGSGDTPATAVIIQGAPDYVAVVAGESQYLEKRFGKPNQDWQVAAKEVYEDGTRFYDLIRLEFPHGAKQSVYFDITTYFKKP